MRHLPVALIALLFVLGGCGGDGDDDSATADDAEAAATSVADETDDADAESESTDAEGSTGATPGSTDLGDFPIPAPPGGEVSNVQTETTRLVSYPASELDNIVAFYEDWIATGTWSPPEGIESNIVVLETGQISATGFVSETQLHTVIGTPDGDRIDVALAVQG